MSDHAEIIREYLTHNYPYADTDDHTALVALDALLAEHAAEVERLRLIALTDGGSSSAVLQLVRERDEARERLAAAESRATELGNALAQERAKPGGSWDRAAFDQVAARLSDLEEAAYYYRRELKEILADCDHDRPNINKIRGRAETAIRAADHALAGAAEPPETPAAA